MKKRLLIATTIPQTLTFFLPIVYYYRSQGWQVHAMAASLSCRSEWIDKFDKLWDVQWTRNPLDPRNLFCASRRVQQVISRECYDLVLVSTPVAAFVTRFAQNLLKPREKPRIIYVAQGFHFYEGGSAILNTIFLCLEKIASQWTDVLIVVNREDEAAARKYNLLPVNRIFYVPGTGIDLQKFNRQVISDEDISTVYQSLGLDPKTPLFLSVAEFIPRKRHTDLLKAFAQLNRPDVHLALAGNGRSLKQMKQLAFDLRVADRVHFLGFRRDIPALMCASIANILVSQQEGLPNAVMEAMCLGVPVIGTKIRGTQDLLSDGCGLLVSLGDVSELADTMRWVLDNPKNAQEIGLRGMTQMTHYAVNPIIKRYDSIFSDTLKY
jgi:glycosyltransferase involved in cell wall biosynthesis